MKTNLEPARAVAKRWQFKRWSAYGIALLSFAAGSLVTARMMQGSQVRPDSNHVFELMIYHTLPGKATALEAIFRDDSKIMAKHGVNVVGFWAPNEDPAWKDTFIYVVDFPAGTKRQNVGTSFMSTRRRDRILKPRSPY